MSSTPKRVLIFALTYYPKFVGGDGVAIKAITDRISPSEYEFHMVTLRLDSTLPLYEKFGNVHIYRVGFARPEPTPEQLVRFPMYLAKIFFPFTAFLKATSLHRKQSFDFVWAMMAYAGFPAVFFNFFFKRVPILLTLQDGDPIEKIVGRARVRAVMPLFRRIFKVTTHVQSISTYLADFARQMGYKGDSTIVPNGVDYKHFSMFDADEVAKIEVSLGKQPGDFWLFTASRLVEKNANDIVIRAIAKLPSSVKFVIAGLGPDLAMLEALAKELGVTDRVIFLGHLPHPSLPNYLRASDAFIRPSRTEGFGNSFVEAMAAETPVIATTAGGIADFLKHDENGLEVGIESVDDVVTQTLRLMSDDGLRERIVRNAQAMVRDRYDWNTVTEEMKEVFVRVQGR
jgi:glycosyltransferase involved in cell wall biosynthesis